MRPARAWTPRPTLCAWALPWLAACQAPAPPSHGELMRGELANIVNAQPSNCGVVLRYVREDRLDYRVECASGQVYRVLVGGDGRVTVKVYDGVATPR